MINAMIDSMMAAVNLRKESTSEGAIEGYEAEALFYAAIAQASSAERQAAALERIADDTRTMALILERAFDPDKDYIHVGDAALERIAAVLEKVTNNEMLSVAFWEQV